MPGFDPETGLPFGVDPDTGLPTTIGTGNVVDPQTAGSNIVDESGTRGDPVYDPDFEAFAAGHPPVNEDGDIEMPAQDARLTGFSDKTSQGSTDMERNSFRGITDAGRTQATKSMQPFYDRANKKMGALADQYQQDVSAAKAIGDQQKLTLDDYTAKEIEHFDALADIRRQQVELNIKARQAEELASAMARQNAEQYMNAYKEEMAGIRPLLMQSGNPLGGLTGIQGGALGAALFAQGFLGARYGIKTNVSEQVNNWVEQEMRAHQNKIANLNQAAQGQLKLYDIARQQGLDDQTTRDRLKGFAIDALKANIYMEAARYQSAQAQNDMKLKLAELDKLQLENDQKLRQNLIKNQYDVYKAEIDAGAEQGRLSIQWAENERMRKKDAEDAKHMQWQRDRTDAQDALNANPPAMDMSWTQIVDPGKPITDDQGNITGYQTTWELDPVFLQMAPKEVINETIKSVQDVNANYISLVKGLDSARQYLEDHPDANKRTLKAGGGFTDNEENREYARRVNAAVMDFRHSMFAGNLTENEQKLVDQFNGEDFLFQRGSNGPQALDDLENLLRGKQEAVIESKQGVRVNPRPGSRRIDSLMNRTKARMAANDAPEAEPSPGQKKEGRITGIDKDRALEGKMSYQYDPQTGPVLSPNQTVSERAYPALGRQVVVGMDNYNTVIDSRSRTNRTGKQEVADGMAALQRLRDTGDREAARIMDQLKAQYPELANYPILPDKRTKQE